MYNLNLSIPNPDKPEKLILYFPLLCYYKEKGDFYYVAYR